MTPIRLRPKAHSEIDEASRWYGSKDRLLGIDFLQEIDAVFARLREHPDAYQIARGIVRRAPIKRFPYNIFYRLYDNEVIVLACVHQHRDPAIWPSRV